MYIYIYIKYIYIYIYLKIKKLRLPALLLYKSNKLFIVTKELPWLF